MTHKETCFCTKRTVEFRSDFEGDTVAKIYCPACVERAPGEAIVFELCEPGEYEGVWAVLYNKGELKRLDPHFRDSDEYFLSLLISGTCGPSIARDYKKSGLCRIFGYKHGPDTRWKESSLPATEEALAEGDDLAAVPPQPTPSKRKAPAKKKKPAKKTKATKKAPKTKKK